MSKNTPKKEDLRFAVLATDVVLFSVYEDTLQTLLIKVDRPPHFDNVPGFPGGLIDPKETADESAARHLREKGGVSPKNAYMEQLYTFSAIERDPRGRVVSVAYLALLPHTKLTALEGESFWKPVGKLGNLAYDHNDILQTAVDRLRSKVKYTNIIQNLMPEKFTLTELQKTYEIVLGRDLDKRNFRRKIKEVTSIEKVGEKRTGGAHRPAELYHFTDSEIRTIDFL